MNALLALFSAPVFAADCPDAGADASFVALLDGAEQAATKRDLATFKTVFRTAEGFRGDQSGGAIRGRQIELEFLWRY